MSTRRRDVDIDREAPTRRAFGVEFRRSFGDMGTGARGATATAAPVFPPTDTLAGATGTLRPSATARQAMLQAAFGFLETN